MAESVALVRREKKVIMMSFAVLVLMAVLSLSSSQSLLVNLDDISLSDLGNIQPGNANADIDFLLQNFKGSLPSRVNLDNFDNKYAYDCYLTGLGSGINRHGDAVLEVTDTKAIFSFGLSTNRITIQCRWKKRVAFIKLSGTVKAYTNKVSIRARLSVDLAPGAHPLLEEFKVTQLDRIRTDVSGAGILNWIGEKILNRKANGAKDKIIRELEQNASKKLQSTLNKLKLPTL